MLTRLVKSTQFLSALWHQLFSLPSLITIFFAISSALLVSSPAYAVTDEYVKRYLEVTEPIPLQVNDQGQTKPFTAEDLSQGKELFKTNCINCHVGGANIPFPPVSLTLDDLAGATPPRDNINNLVAFFRQPMTYDGSEESFWCREVTESWMSQEQVEQLAAFILRAAQKAPGWGSKSISQ
ncbi:photosystem II cytochrome PsbV2 [Lyngbya aestuarii]|uniref:photosystem II cytochrome PsbV2 n=1 Tax=Lyngbya aestuarii TaxID=118322 RepID=UPI00403E16C8